MNDYRKIARNLYNLTKLILNLYKKLADLEINNQQDTDEYANIFRKLKCALAEEYNIYEALKENSDIAYELFDIFFPDGMPRIAEELEMIKGHNKDILIRLRIAENLNDVVLEEDFVEEKLSDFISKAKEDAKIKTVDIEELSEEERKKLEDIEDIDCFDEDGEIDVNRISEEVFEKLFDYFINDDFESEMQKEFLKEIEFDRAIEKDILCTILKVIKMYIDKGKDKDSLIDFKTKLIFVFPELENLMLENNMKIPEELVWTSFMVGNSQGNDTKQIKIMIEYYYILDMIDSALRAYNNANNIKDLDLRKEKILYTEILFRSSMMFINSEYATFIMDFIDKKYSNLAYELDINDSLNRVFTSRIDDTSIPYILSLDGKFKR